MGAETPRSEGECVKASTMLFAAYTVLIAMAIPHSLLAWDRSPEPYSPGAYSSLRGPIPIQHIHPLLLGVHTAEPAWLPPPDAPPTWIEHSFIGANSYLLDGGWFVDDLTAVVDTETYLNRTTLTLRPHRRLTNRLSVRHVGLAGGWFDGVIEAHHALFSLPNAGREERPKNVSRVSIKKGDELWLDHSGGSRSLSRVTLDTRVRMAELALGRAALGESPVFAAGIQSVLSVPTAASSFVTGTGSVDGEITGIAQLENYPWEVYANLGWLRYGRPRVETGLPLQRNALRYGLSWIWSPSSVLALQLQILGQTGPVDTEHSRLGGHMSIAGFGFSLHPSPYVDIFFSFVEEFFTFSASDVALALGLRIKSEGP